MKPIMKMHLGQIEKQHKIYRGITLPNGTIYYLNANFATKWHRMIYSLASHRVMVETALFKSHQHPDYEFHCKPLETDSLFKRNCMVFYDITELTFRDKCRKAIRKQEREILFRQFSLKE